MPDNLEFEHGLDPALLARYFMGDCTGAELQAFERWVVARPERQELVAELRAVWRLQAGTAEQSFDRAAAWDKITKQLGDRAARPALRIERGGQGASPRMLVRQPPSTWSRVARRAAIAAGLLLVTGSGAWLAFRDTVGTPTKFATYSTEQGGRSAVTLADGTRVTLGPRTRLRVDMNGANPARDVELDGQAFFQVAHDPRHPFRVRARSAEAHVLGTEFAVRAFADEHEVQVAVRSGRVAVRGDTAASAAGRGRVLTAGQQATIVSGGVVRVGQAADSSAFAWASGVLRFESTPFGDIAHEMSRWIGLDIAVPDSALRSTRVTIAFTDLSRDSVLARLARVAGVRPVATDDGVTFRVQPN